jgi:hypothetical protein
MHIDIIHTITWKAAWMYDQGRNCTREASVVKLFCSETTLMGVWGSGLLGEER